MVSVASGGTVDRMAARTLIKVLRAGSGTPARYSSTSFGAPLPFAAELRLPDFTFFMRAMLQEAPIQVYASARRAAVRHEKCHTVFRHTCTCPYSRDYRRGPIKGNVKRKISPSARCRHFFVSAFSPTCLNVHSRFESGLAQAESLISLRRPIKGNVKRKISPSARCRHFFVSAFSPTCLNVHSRFESGLAQAESLISFRRVTRRDVSSFLWFHTFVATAPFVSETSSLTVIHFMGGNAWSYPRLVAYGFLGLSRCEVIRNVELAREGPANRGLRYFQLHISRA